MFVFTRIVGGQRGEIAFSWCVLQNWARKSCSPQSLSHSSTRYSTMLCSCAQSSTLPRMMLLEESRSHKWFHIIAYMWGDQVQTQKSEMWRPTSDVWHQELSFTHQHQNMTSGDPSECMGLALSPAGASASSASTLKWHMTRSTWISS